VGIREKGVPCCLDGICNTIQGRRDKGKKIREDGKLYLRWGKEWGRGLGASCVGPEGVEVCGCNTATWYRYFFSNKLAFKNWLLELTSPVIRGKRALILSLSKGG